MKQRLSNWKARTLSFAGRVTLAKSVIQSMPTYVMQSSILPRTTCDEIDKLCRGFIWGDEVNHRRIHLLSWDKLCKPKKEGGLGLRSSREANSALMLKAIWNLCSNPKDMWSAVIRHKYKCGRNDFPVINLNKKGSNFWKGLTQLWNQFRNNLCWEMGNGEAIRFWSDNWFEGCDKLISYCTTIPNESTIQHPISKFTTYAGGWNVSTFDSWLPETITRLIANSIPPYASMNDKFTWGGNPDGTFTTKSAYVILKGNTATYNAPIFQIIWKWRGTERIRTLLWKLGHGVMLTNSERKRRTMTNDSTCQICQLGEETLFHCFRDCPKARSVWFSLGVENHANFFNNQNWIKWMEMNLKSEGSNKLLPYWSILFGVTLDVLWRNRNDLIFNQNQSNIQGSIITIRCHVSWILNTMKKNPNLQPNLKNKVEIEESGWQPPRRGFVKLNCDAAVRDAGRNAGCGGVLRDCFGRLIFAFSHKLETCNAIEAEMWSIYHGVSIAYGKGFDKILVESDSMEAIEMLKKKGGDNEMLQTLVKSIIEIGNDSLEVEWLKVNRKFNAAADLLAKNSQHIEDKFVIFEVPPDFLVNLIMLDCIGIPSPSGL